MSLWDVKSIKNSCDIRITNGFRLPTNFKKAYSNTRLNTTDKS